MKRQVRDSGSNPLSARLASWYLPSRSVKYVNMKNESQSGVRSLNAPRIRGLSRSPDRALEQRLGLLAAVAAEVGVEQIDHRPEVAALLDVHLEEVAEIVERRARPPELALLLDRRGLGVPLRDDQPPESPAVLARHVLPRRLAAVDAEADRVGPSPARPRKIPQR